MTNTPRKPEGMPPEADRLWELIIRAKEGEITKEDGPALELCCRYFAEAQAQIKLAAMFDQMDVLKERHACIRAAKIASSEYAIYSARFGLTPRDRASLTRLIELPEPEDDLSEFGM